MQPAIVESPFKTVTIELADGTTVTIDEAKNVEYAKACCLWALDQCYSPYASHLFFTQFLDDSIPEQRKLGIAAGITWGHLADVRLVVVDRGFTEGMIYGYEATHRGKSQPVKVIKLGGDWDLGWITGPPLWSDVLGRLDLRD